MAASIYISRASTVPTNTEVDHIAKLLEKSGRITVLVPSSREVDLCHRAFADAGLCTGIDVITPNNWIATIWELLGNGYHIVTPDERHLLMAHVLQDVAEKDSEALDPLQNNPGTVSTLVQIARDCLPAALKEHGDRHNDVHLSPAEETVLSLLEHYDGFLKEHNLIETSSAAVRLVENCSDVLPPLMHTIVVRGLPQIPEYALRLFDAVAQQGELCALYNDYQEPMTKCLAERFSVKVQPLDDEPASVASTPDPDYTFAEIVGPTARAAAYAKIVADHVQDGEQTTSVAVVSPHPLQTFRMLAPRLAARDIAVQTLDTVKFPETRSGAMFFALIDLFERINKREASVWWPAPELADWLRSPFCGTYELGSAEAIKLDTCMRKTRNISKVKLFERLEKLQRQLQNREYKIAQEHDSESVNKGKRKPRPVVVKDVLDAIDEGDYEEALTRMLSAAVRASSKLFGQEGSAAQQTELYALREALNIAEKAHDFHVPAESLRIALSALTVDVSRVSSFEEIDKEGQHKGSSKSSSKDASLVPAVHIMSVQNLASADPGAYTSVVFVDSNVDDYPLQDRESVGSILAEKLNYSGLKLSKASILRLQVVQALRAASNKATFARVSRNNVSDELYPALFYAEYCPKVEKSDAPEEEKPVDPSMLQGLPSEQDVFSNVDAYGGSDASFNKDPRIDEHTLPKDVQPYVMLSQKSVSGKAQTRTLSASQIENYLACPYRWFVSNRVKTRRLDVEFGPIERGNFAHDVMQHFYERLADAGIKRVTEENLDRCLIEFDEAFDEISKDHESGTYTHGKYKDDPRPVRGGLVPLNKIEEKQLEAMRSQLRAVIRNDANMLPTYEPSCFEYSFDKEEIEYAGYPLGGRIDRIDVAPSAGSGERFVVIDYKTSSVSGMKCPDPTMNLDEGEHLEETWLPGRDKDKAPKVQTLIYASAYERISGGSAQGAVYYSLKKPAVAGAVSDALVDRESPAFPCKDKPSGYPGIKGSLRSVKHDGSMEFSELLTHVEHAIGFELDQMKVGCITPKPASNSCKYCPLITCEKRR